MRGGSTPNAYYVGTATDFFIDSRHPSAMVGHLTGAHGELNEHQNLDITQQRAWSSEIIFLRDLFRDAGLRDQVILLEAILDGANGTKNRIDTLLCGRDHKGEASAMPLELKTWHTRWRNDRRYTFGNNPDGTLKVSLHTRSRSGDQRVSHQDHWNPIKQSWYYADLLRKSLEHTSSPEQKPVIMPSVVLYNCTQISQEFRGILEKGLSQEELRVPVFTKKGCDKSFSRTQLATYINKNVGGGDGCGVYNQILPALGSANIQVAQAADLEPEESELAPEERAQTTFGHSLLKWFFGN